MIGLGRMGSGIALNIAKAGFPLSLYDTEEGLAQELRDNWIKNHDLPSGKAVSICHHPKCIPFVSQRSPKVSHARTCKLLV